MNSEPLMVVFSDVDGCLLDHNTYSFDAASRALDTLARASIPLILCSSKTRAEIAALQRDLGTRHPFIAENGGALFLPVGYFPFSLPGARRHLAHEIIEFGRPYGEVIHALHNIARKLRVEVVGFSDMTVEQVARDCGLSLLQARLAKLREYDEPFRIVDSSPATRNRLFRALHRAGLRCTRGGRYDHVTGATDKGISVATLRSLYNRAYGRVLTVGLGDSLNDVSLLREVDVPIVVQNPAAGATERLLRKVPNARVTAAHGPSGWAEAIVEVVEQHRVLVPVTAGSRGSEAFGPHR